MEEEAKSNLISTERDASELLEESEKEDTINQKSDSQIQIVNREIDYTQDILKNHVPEDLNLQSDYY